MSGWAHSDNYGMGVSDDLESFYHTMLWCAMRFLSHNGLRHLFAVNYFNGPDRHDRNKGPAENGKFRVMLYGQLSIYGHECKCSLYGTKLRFYMDDNRVKIHPLTDFFQEILDLFTTHHYQAHAWIERTERIEDYRDMKDIFERWLTDETRSKLWPEDDRIVSLPKKCEHGKLEVEKGQEMSAGSDAGHQIEAELAPDHLVERADADDAEPLPERLKFADDDNDKLEFSSDD